MVAFLFSHVVISLYASKLLLSYIAITYFGSTYKNPLTK